MPFDWADYPDIPHPLKPQVNGGRPMGHDFKVAEAQIVESDRLYRTDVKRVMIERDQALARAEKADAEVERLKGMEEDERAVRIMRGLIVRELDALNAEAEVERLKAREITEEDIGSVVRECRYYTTDTGQDIERAVQRGIAKFREIMVSKPPVPSLDEAEVERLRALVAELEADAEKNLLERNGEWRAHQTRIAELEAAVTALTANVAERNAEVERLRAVGSPAPSMDEEDVEAIAEAVMGTVYLPSGRAAFTKNAIEAALFVARKRRPAKPAAQGGHSDD